MHVGDSGSPTATSLPAVWAQQGAPAPKATASFSGWAALMQPGRVPGARQRLRKVAGTGDTPAGSLWLGCRAEVSALHLSPKAGNVWDLRPSFLRSKLAGPAVQGT